MDIDERRSEVRIFMISPVRIYREGLAHVLGETPAIRIVGMASHADEAAALLADTCADVTLFDISDAAGLAEVRRLSSVGHKVVVLGVTEDAEMIVSCAEAGIAGYVTRNDSLAVLAQTIREAAHGEFTCPPHIAGCLLRRLAFIGEQKTAVASRPRLTAREQEIVRLIDLGLSNKEIARRLSIQMATVKNHVHNILKKLGVSHRADAAVGFRASQVRFR